MLSVSPQRDSKRAHNSSVNTPCTQPCTDLNSCFQFQSSQKDSSTKRFCEHGTHALTQPPRVSLNSATSSATTGCSPWLRFIFRSRNLQTMSLFWFLHLKSYRVTILFEMSPLFSPSHTSLQTPIVPTISRGPPSIFSKQRKAICCSQSRVSSKKISVTLRK